MGENCDIGQLLEQIDLQGRSNVETQLLVALGALTLQDCTMAVNRFKRKKQERNKCWTSHIGCCQRKHSITEANVLKRIQEMDSSLVFVFLFQVETRLEGLLCQIVSEHFAIPLKKAWETENAVIRVVG